MCYSSLQPNGVRPQMGALSTTTFRGNRPGVGSRRQSRSCGRSTPGTELAFEDEFKYEHRWIWKKRRASKVCRFRQGRTIPSPISTMCDRISERKLCSMVTLFEKASGDGVQCPSTFKTRYNLSNGGRIVPSSAATFQLLGLRSV